VRSTRTSSPDRADGRDLGTLLDQAPIIAKSSVGGGAPSRSLGSTASKWLTMVALTQVADASRGFVAADIGAAPRSPGTCGC
jgi:hypothetical protein